MPFHLPIVVSNPGAAPGWPADHSNKNIGTVVNWLPSVILLEIYRCWFPRVVLLPSSGVLLFCRQDCSSSVVRIVLLPSSGLFLFCRQDCSCSVVRIVLLM